MQIAFLMDPPESIDPQYETTAALMYEAYQRGHSVFFLEAHDIDVRRQQIAARIKEIAVPAGLSLEAYWQAAIGREKEGPGNFKALTELDAIFLRKNPPLDCSAMELLALIGNQGFVLNDPRGMILASSKVYTLNFPELIPQTHISRDPSRLRSIIDSFDGDMVIKPPGRYGGQGIIRVSRRDPENLDALINYYVGGHKPWAARNQIMLQEYLPAVKNKGDVRILLLNGEILGAMGRKPAEDSFRTNICAGGKALPHTITAREREICEQIRPRLIADGLHFVGLDLIDERLIEINCVSPGGIVRINRLEGTHIEARVIDFIETRGRTPKAAVSLL